jgi:hypothetical protein
MEILHKISHTSFLQSNNSLCLLVSEENFLKIPAIEKQELPVETMFLSNQDEMRKSYRERSINDSCKISLYLAKWFQWRFLEKKYPKIASDRPTVGQSKQFLNLCLL